MAAYLGHECDTGAQNAEQKARLNEQAAGTGCGDWGRGLGGDRGNRLRLGDLAASGVGPVGRVLAVRGVGRDSRVLSPIPGAGCVAGLALGDGESPGLGRG